MLPCAGVLHRNCSQNCGHFQQAPTAATAWALIARFDVRANAGGLLARCRNPFDPFGALIRTNDVRRNLTLAF